MARFVEIEELMWRYARRGVRDWVQSGESGRQEKVEKHLGARIVNNEEFLEATAALTGGLAQVKGLIPVPDLSVGNIKWVFFKPLCTSDGELMFDLVFWLPGNKHIGFRLEPAHQYRDGRHKYSHVQLSSRFDDRRIVPADPLDWLPRSYPAFPVPGTHSLDRFLMLVVALHGFPDRTRTVLAEISVGRLGKGQAYVNRVHRLLNPA